jgi:hypothetical protein
LEAANAIRCILAQGSTAGWSFAGVLGGSIPEAAQGTLQASMGSRPVNLLAYQQPDPLKGDHQVRKLLRLAAVLEANGDTAQVVRL